MKTQIKATLLLFTIFTILSCSKDDETTNNDKIIGTWELIEYNQTIFEGGDYSSYRCLNLGSNDLVFRSDGSCIAYWIECGPMLSAENPIVNVDLEYILDNGIGQALTRFLWENKNGKYYVKEVFDDGTLSPEVEFPLIFLDNNTKLRSPETEDMGELVWQKKQN